MSFSLKKLVHFTPVFVLSGTILATTPIMASSVGNLPTDTNKGIIVQVPKIEPLNNHEQKEIYKRVDTVSTALPSSVGVTAQSLSSVANIASTELNIFFAQKNHERKITEEKILHEKAVKDKEKAILAARKAKIEKTKAQKIAAGKSKKKQIAKLNAAARTKAKAAKVAQAKALSAKDAAKKAVTAKADTIKATDAKNNLKESGRTAYANPLPKTILNTPAMRCQVDSGDDLMRPWVGMVKTRIAFQFGISNIGGTRRGDPRDHGKGLALDVMVPVGSPIGDQVNAWALKNAKSLNIKYTIWEQKIYHSGSSKGKMMEDRGGMTANHFDHVHISFNNGSGICPNN